MIFYQGIHPQHNFQVRFGKFTLVCLIFPHLFRLLLWNKTPLNQSKHILFAWQLIAQQKTLLLLEDRKKIQCLLLPFYYFIYEISIQYFILIYMYQDCIQSSKKRNASDHQTLSFISHLFNQKQLEPLTATKIYGSQLPSLIKKSVTTRLNPAQIEIVNFRSKSSFKEINRATTPNKACRIRALKFLRERQLSPTALLKLRTSLTYRQQEN
ncbi:hypothetical protein FGO68_gene1694 [Halteria grandinella]|uniref:Uncharacterized protein n=1 Tax=Halteria grandinella TaxID=5974 RepID=A0A8J8NHC2_HALGN|nr:hypothetical protein FGO68_gene1694 [Halteria grandinella]